MRRLYTLLSVLTCIFFVFFIYYKFMNEETQVSVETLIKNM